MHSGLVLIISLVWACPLIIYAFRWTLSVFLLVCTALLSHSPPLSLTHPSFVEMMYIYYCSSNWIWTRATTEIVNVKFATHKKHETKTNAYEFIIEVGFLDVILPFLSNASNI